MLSDYPFEIESPAIGWLNFGRLFQNVSVLGIRIGQGEAPVDVAFIRECPNDTYISTLFLDSTKNHLTWAWYIPRKMMTRGCTLEMIEEGESFDGVGLAALVNGF